MRLSISRILQAKVRVIHRSRRLRLDNNNQGLYNYKTSPKIIGLELILPVNLIPTSLGLNISPYTVSTVHYYSFGLYDLWFITSQIASCTDFQL